MWCTFTRVYPPDGPWRSERGRGPGGTNLSPNPPFGGSRASRKEFWLMRDFYLELKASLPGLAVYGVGAGFRGQELPRQSFCFARVPHLTRRKEQRVVRAVPPLPEEA